MFQSAIVSVLWVTITSMHVIGVVVTLPSLAIALLARLFRRHIPSFLSLTSKINVIQVNRILVMFKILNSLQLQGVSIANAVCSMHKVGRFFNLVITHETMRSKPKFSIPWPTSTCGNNPFRILWIKCPGEITILLRGASTHEPSIRILSYILWRALEYAQEQRSHSIVAAFKKRRLVLRIVGQSEALSVPKFDRVVDQDVGHNLRDKLGVPLAACLLSHLSKLIWCEVAEYDSADLTDDYFATGLRLVRFSD